MSIAELLILVLGVGLLVAGIHLARKIRSFHAPPADRNEELSRRVERLLEQSRKEDTDAPR